MTTPIPVEPKPEFGQYAWLAGLALCGSIARAGKWTDGDGKFMLSKLVTELASAIVLGSLAVGMGSYFSLKPAIVGGLAGGLGLLGAAGVTGVIQSIVSTKFGGNKNASDTKPS